MPRSNTTRRSQSTGDHERRRTLPKPGRPSPAAVMLAASNLPARHRTLLDWLYQMRYATTEQVHRRHFASPSVDAEKSLRDCRRRLWELGAAGLVAGIVINQRGRAWVLDRLGLMVTEELLQIPAERRIQIDQWGMSSMYIPHYTAITEVACQLYERGIQHQWLSRPRLVIDHASDASWAGATPTAYELLHPDATVLMRWGRVNEGGQWEWGGWDPVYLEVDRNTEDPAIIAGKLERYQRALMAWTRVSDEERARLGHAVAPQENCFLLFACTDAGRARRIQQQIDAHSLAGLAVPLDQAGAVLANIWQLMEDHIEQLRRKQQEQTAWEQADRRRREEAAERERRRMAWAEYDRALDAYQRAEEEYVVAHRGFFRGDDRCRQEYRQQKTAPAPPPYPRPMG